MSADRALHPGRTSPVASMGTAGAAVTRRPGRLRSPKARSAAECDRLEQLPNIGPSLAADLRRLGIGHPRELAGRDAFSLYQGLCAATGRRHDPCVLDAFIAAVDFMRGAQARPWWTYTAWRKATFGAL
jgi:hypothetical protein